MAALREIKNRLRGVRKTQQITRAMKMVATVKLRRAQTALANGRPYAERIRALVATLFSRLDPELIISPFFSRRPVKNILLIIVAADRGLCGNMNTNIFRQALRAIEDFNAPEHIGPKPEIHLYLIGRKTRDFFKARQNIQAETMSYRINAADNFVGIDAGRLGRQCCEFYCEGKFDRIELFYNESSSALQHRPVRALLFPLDLARARKDAVLSANNLLIEPDCAAVADDVIGGYIASEVRRMLMEAEVAEHAARMLMMDLATKNADDLIAAMQLKMNKLRQLSITNELADITTGAAAVA